MSEAVPDLLNELRQVVANAVASHPQGALFAALPETLGSNEGDRLMPGSDGGHRKVVDEWLEACVHNSPEPWRSLSQLLLTASPEIPWMRAYENLESTLELERFREFYSYQLLAGPIFRGYRPAMLIEDVLVGFTLQAPNIFYPAHHHESPEMYGVISGTLEWQVGDDWTTVHPGEVIVHRSHESHAMRTLDEPALTWVVWSGNPHSPVYMPSLDPPDATMEPRRYP